MKTQRLSIVASFPPEGDSEYMSEYESFVDVVHPEHLSVQDFVSKHEYLVAGLAGDHGITVEVCHDDEDVAICLFDLEVLGDKLESVMDEFAEAFFGAVRDNGFEMMAVGTVEQEIKVDDELTPAQKAMLN